MTTRNDPSEEIETNQPRGRRMVTSARPAMSGADDSRCQRGDDETEDRCRRMLKLKPVPFKKTILKRYSKYTTAVDFKMYSL